MVSQFNYRDLEFESPFTQESNGPQESSSYNQQLLIDVELLNPLEDNYTDLSGAFSNELQGSEWSEAGRLNLMYMKDDQLRWGNYSSQIIDLLTNVTGMPIMFVGVINPAFFISAVDQYQQMRGLKPTNKGVIAIGTWSQMQDDLGFLQYRPVKIDIEKAIGDNKTYSRDVWGNYVSSILQYFTRIGITRDSLPLDSKYFALCVAKWQTLRVNERLSVDGILGPKSWSVLKTQISPSQQPLPGTVPAQPTAHIPTKWLNLFSDAVPSSVKPFVYGLETFKAIADAIRTAKNEKHYIYILGWMLEIDFRFIPDEPNSTLFHLLQEVTKENKVEVRILIWDNLMYRSSLGAIRDRLNRLNNTKVFYDNQTSGSPQIEQALVELRSIISKVPDRLKEEVQDNSSWKSVNKYKDQVNEGSHHEKIIVVNGESGLIGFCGGIDINVNRIGNFVRCADTSDTRCVPNTDKADSKRYLPAPLFDSSKGWPEVTEILHDVHCQVKGHAAWKLLNRFKQRWHHFQAGQSAQDDVLRGERQPKPAPSSFADINTSYVKIAHTFNPRNRTAYDAEFPIGPDRTIWYAVKQAIQNAEKSIHIEDQYMLSIEIATLLNKQLHHHKALTVSFLTQDDEYAGEDIPVIKRMRAEFMNHLYKGFSKNEPRINVHMLNKSLAFPAHHQVHSKLYIIDRELTIIGSANCSRRSMTNDTECAAIIFNNIDRRYDFVSKLEQKYDRVSTWIPYEPNPKVEDIDIVLLRKLTMLAATNPLAIAPIGSLIVIQPQALIILFSTIPDLVQRIVDPYDEKVKLVYEQGGIPELSSISPFTEIEFDEVSAYEGESQFDLSDREEWEYEEEETTTFSTEDENQSSLSELWATENLEHNHDHAEMEDMEEELEDLETKVEVTPPLMGEDLSVPGYTMYVKIDLGRGNYPLNKTGIYIPASFNPDASADIIIYLHGMTSAFPGSHAQIDDYWKSVKLPAYDLRIREEINASGKNVILVAPSLGKSPNAYANTLSGKPNGLDTYMQNVIASINEYVFTRKYNKGTFNPERIILAAHSAGGSQMLRIASANNPLYGSKVKECWGLDSLYGGVYNWIEWAKKYPEKKLFIYYKWSTSENALRLKNKSQAIPNIYVKASSGINHFWVVKAHLQERTINIGKSEISKLNFEGESFRNENDELESLFETVQFRDLMNAQTAQGPLFELEEPMAVPQNSPVPFAPLPLSGGYWPIDTKVSEGRLVSFQATNGETKGSSSRKFMANRTTKDGSGRYHAGIDLYCKFNEPVIACEDGVILSFKHFYTTNGGNDTNCLIVQHPQVVINYGEVGPSSLGRLNLKVGDKVKAGQVIGFVGATNMLHFEIYTIDVSSRDQPPFRWMKSDRNPPSRLLNPTKYLLYLQSNGLRAASPPTTTTTITPQPSLQPLPVTSSTWEKAIRLNKYYGEKLQWNQHHEQINDLVLPFSGLQQVSLGEEDFAIAVAGWQKQQGLSSDGVIGPDTWLRMKPMLIPKSSTPPQSSGNIPNPSTTATIGQLGRLVINTAAPALSSSQPVYQFTADDALWLIRFVEGEAGGRNDADNHAVIWAMFNRFGMLRHAVSSWTSFGRFLQMYSTTLQPLLNSVGAAKRVWAAYKDDPVRNDVVSSNDTYSGTDIQKVQYKRHIALQRKGWTEFQEHLRIMVINMLTGQIPNPGIGIASDFASTYILFRSARRERGLSLSFTDDEWRQYTLDFARGKNRIWIGDKANLNQKKNAFFIDPRFRDVPANAVRVEMLQQPESLSEENFFYPESELETFSDEITYESIDVETTGEEFYHDEYGRLNEYEANAQSSHGSLFELEDLVSNLSKAVALNRSYSVSLGWNAFHDQINDLLLPFSGQQNVSLGEEAFAQAVAAWQLSKGYSTKDSDGIIGPNTWRMMKPILTITTPPVNPVTTAFGGNAQVEWTSSTNLQSRYSTWQTYEIIRNQVISWGISNPYHYIDSALTEWKSASTDIKTHFGNNFDGDPHRSYLNLKRLYGAKGISDPAAYFTNNIIYFRFFGSRSPGHRDLGAALSRVESALKSAGHNYTFTTAWSFVPRTHNDDITELSNHAIGKAIDINSGANPHIDSSRVILVINAVCQSVMPGGLLAESNPDVFRSASSHFRQTFNDQWINAQTRADIVAALRHSRTLTKLRTYASRGFFDLPTPLVTALKNEGLRWGGDWRREKDLMHFEIT